MNRDDVDLERLAGAGVFVLAFAFVDVPSTLTEYAACGLVVAAALVVSVNSLRANRTVRVAVGATCLALGVVKLAGALAVSNTVTALGLDGMFALLVVADVLGSEYRWQNPLPE